jgi:Fur family ferric uptake transcriptional regulator
MQSRVADLGSRPYFACVAAKQSSLAEKLDWALGFCRERGMRRTHALQQILRVLFKKEHPVGWSNLAKEPELRDSCNPSSVFRILVKLEEIGLVRRLGSPGRSYYFMLNLPGEHHEHIICTECGKIENLDLDCPVHALEKDVRSATRYREIYHQLDFFGICPTCRAG